MPRRCPENVAEPDAFKELESMLPFLARTRYRENEVIREKDFAREILPVYGRVVRSHVHWDARLFVESLKHRELTRSEAEKTRRVVEDFLERFFKG